MESTVLTVKFVLFLAVEVFVVATLGAVLILALYRFAKNRVRESGYLSEVISDINAVSPAGLPVSHKS